MLPIYSQRRHFYFCCCHAPKRTMKRLKHNVKFHPLWNNSKKHFSKKVREKINHIKLCPSTVNIIVFSFKLCKIAKYYPCKDSKLTQANADALACTNLIKNRNSISVAKCISNLFILGTEQISSSKNSKSTVHIVVFEMPALGTNEGSTDHWSVLSFAKLNSYPQNSYPLNRQDPFTIYK